MNCASPCHVTSGEISGAFPLPLLAVPNQAMPNARMDYLRRAGPKSRQTSRWPRPTCNDPHSPPQTSVFIDCSKPLELWQWELLPYHCFSIHSIGMSSCTPFTSAEKGFENRFMSFMAVISWKRWKTSMHNDLSTVRYCTAVQGCDLYFSKKHSMSDPNKLNHFRTL